MSFSSSTRHVPTEARFRTALLAGIGAFGLFVGCAGEAQGEKGMIKALAFLTSAAAFAGAALTAKEAAQEGAIADDARKVEQERFKQMELIRSEVFLDIEQALLEEKAIRELAGAPKAIAASESPRFFEVFEPEEVEEGGEAAATVTVDVGPRVARELGQPAKPQPKSERMPDGAVLVQPSAIAEINNYPVIMAIAGMGAGKTSTVRYLFSQMSGTTVLASPKATHLDIPSWDIVFGYNPLEDKSGWFGEPQMIDASYLQDLVSMGDDSGATSMIEFAWGLYSTIKIRQAQGHHRQTEADTLRVFYDEAAYTYTCGYTDPSDAKSKAEKAAKSIIEAANKSSLFDARSNRIQVVWGSQSESVDTIGFQNISAARDDMWHLFPGKEAIAAAEKHGKSSLANWFKRRQGEGFAIALLEKQGQFFHVVDLPKLEALIS